MPLSKLDFKHIELVELAIFREITSFSIDKFQLGFPTRIIPTRTIRVF